MILSVCKRIAAGLAVGAFLGTAAPVRADAVLLAAGNIGHSTAPAQRRPHLTADPGSTLHPATGRHGVAELLLKRAIAIDEKVHGPDHPGLVTSLNKLAVLYWATGRHGAAEPLLKRAVAIDKKALGPEHPDLASRLNNLAVLYWATGRHGAAEPLFARALTILEKSLPPGHPALAAVRENYAGFLDTLGRRGEAAAARWSKTRGRS